MVRYVDENGIEIDVNKVLTIIMDVKLTSEGGVDFYFLCKRQYLFEDTSTRMSYYFNCEETTVQRPIKHYRVIIDDETYYVPDCFVVIEGRLRALYEQDVDIWRVKKADQPRNWIAEYEKITGIDLSKRHEEQHDGYDLWKESLKDLRAKTKIDADFEQDDDKSKLW